jgi:hypothetical protein
MVVNAARFLPRPALVNGIAKVFGPKLGDEQEVKR